VRHEAQAREVNSRIAPNVDVMIGKVVEAYPNFQVVATTLRTVKTAGINDWGAICWYDGEFHEAEHRPDLDILDRVGGGARVVR